MATDKQKHLATVEEASTYHGERVSITTVTLSILGTAHYRPGEAVLISTADLDSEPDNG